ncbi:MAG: hypothetical protein Q8P18_34070 [Pseudomonadota bacterium]|nr:hypothetical protein [Pseudomonadota bacterium]
MGVEPGVLGRVVGIELAAAALMAVVPAWMFTGPLGPFRAPGLEGEGLYGQLFAGALVRRWLTGGAAPGVADVVGGEVWWPVSPLGAGLQAVLPVDPAFALGIVVTLGVWLAGYGPWRLARRVLPSAPLWGALCAGLAAQTSPVVLRAIPAGELAALAVGAIALGLAHPRLALIGGLWSAPGAVVLGIAGLFGRRPAWLLAVVPALALLLPASTLPGAVRRTVASQAVSATSPAYVTASGSAFPLPPGEQTALIAAAELTRTGLWIPGEVSPLVRGNLFRGPPPTPGTGRDGASGSWGGALPRNAPPGGPGPLDPLDPLDPLFGVGGVGPLDPVEDPVEGAGGPDPAGAPELYPPVAPQEGAAPEPMAGGSPPPDAPPVASSEEQPWIGGLLIPLQRLHGGAAALFGLLALLLIGAPGNRAVRIAAAGGLLFWGALTLAFGWPAVPGEVERDPALVAGLRILLSADQIAAIPGGGVLAWAAILPALGGLGIAALSGVSRLPLAARVAACVVLVGVGAPLENPRLIAPVATVPPDPVRRALAALPSDRLLLFPAPQWPYLQGQRPTASAFWEAAATGQRMEPRGEDPAAAALIGALTALTAVPVDIQAAHLLWSSRSGLVQEGDEPLRAAYAAGWRYLLVDLEGLPPLGRPRIDGWLAERAGMPVARDGSRLLYDLSEGPAGVR